MDEKCRTIFADDCEYFNQSFGVGLALERTINRQMNAGKSFDECREEYLAIWRESKKDSGTAKAKQAGVAAGKAPDLFSTFKSHSSQSSDLLNAICTIEKDPSSLRHYIAFLQSSGYGKTRECLELLKRERKGAYLLCEDIDGGFNQNPLIDKLIVDYSEASSDTKQQLEIVTEFLTGIRLFIDQPGTAETLFEMQFNMADKSYKADFSLSSPDRNDEGMLAAQVEPERNSTKEPTACRTSAAEPHSPVDTAANNKSFTTPGKNQSGGHMGLVIFDEAHALCKGGMDLLAMIKVALDSFNMIGVFVSTCGKLVQVVPRTNSYRGTHRTDLKPVSALLTTDLFTHHCLLRGRPLWHNYLSSRKNRTYKDLVEYALWRLRSLNENATESFKLALFMCRIGGLTPTNHDNATMFVERHLATYVDISVVTDDRDNKRRVQSTIAYPSEPVLAEASSFCTSRLCPASRAISKQAVLETVAEQIRYRTTIVNYHKGDLGELLACALILYLLDSLRESKIDCYDPEHELGSMSHPIVVSQFIAALCPSVEILGEAMMLSDYTINATHFVRLPYVTTSSTCKVALDRCAGIITREYSRGLDFFLVARKKSAPQNGAVDELSVDMSGLQLTEPIGTYKGSPVYETKEGAMVCYAQGILGPKSYVSMTDYDKIVRGDPGPRSEVSGGTGDICIRFSCKNLASDVSEAAAQDFLTAIDSQCEPISTAGSAPNSLRVSVLINVGTGKITPKAYVTEQRVTSSERATNVVHIMIATGLNPTDNGECFRGLPVELLNLIKNIAKSQDAKALGEKESELLLGHEFSEDRRRYVNNSKIDVLESLKV